MGRSQAIDPDELFETANRLEAEGKEVTALSLLNALGRGSLTTIYKHLENWKSAKPAKPAGATADMPDRVKSAFAVAWREAAQEADREVHAVKEKAAEEVKAALRQFHGALEAIEKLERESEAESLVSEALKNQVSEQQAEIADLRRTGAGLKAAADELRQQVESQKAELERQQADRDKAIKEAAELRGRADTLQSQNDLLLAKLSGKEDKN